NRVVVSLRGDELAEHGLGHGRPADVARADEADTEDRRLIEWSIEAHAPIVPPRPLLHSEPPVSGSSWAVVSADGWRAERQYGSAGNQEVHVNPDPQLVAALRHQLARLSELEATL